jgi:mannosyltransferase OCH1-like enzyme
MIPKIIHHVWPDVKPLKAKFVDWRLSCMQHNPDYSFMFHDFNNYAPDVYCHSSLTTEIWRLISHSDLLYTCKSDIMRLEVLYRYGGIYLDTDCQCLKSFDDLLGSSFVGYENEREINLGFSVIGVEPGNQYVFDALKCVVSVLNNTPVEVVNSNPALYTGPLCSTPYLMQLDKKCPYWYFYPLDYTKSKASLERWIDQAYVVHHWSGLDEDGWTKTIKGWDSVDWVEIETRLKENVAEMNKLYMSRRGV